MQKLVEKILKYLARRILYKQKPELVLVTGSIGKTSAKEAIYSVLSHKFLARKNIKNYNNELGVPLTIIGEAPPGKSVLGWTKILFKALSLICFKNSDFPKILVLEIAADKPGDLDYLMEIFKSSLIRASFLTAIAPVHLEFFHSMEHILEEKTIPFRYLNKESVAVVNLDNCEINKVKTYIKSKLLTYGLSAEAQVRGKILKITERGIEFEVHYHHEKFNLILKDGVSSHQILPLLAGFSAGLCFGMNYNEIISGLTKYKITPGRMVKRKGIKETVIIDDSYNSSPVAAEKALIALAALPFGKRKIAVLGDMLELGEKSIDFHRQVLRKGIEIGIDCLVLFGEEQRKVFEELSDQKIGQTKIFYFADRQKLIDFLVGFINKGDIILVKGSRKMKLEKVVERLKADE